STRCSRSIGAAPRGSSCAPPNRSSARAGAGPRGAGARGSSKWTFSCSATSVCASPAWRSPTQDCWSATSWSRRCASWGSGRAGVREPVPDAGYREDVVGPRRLAFDLAPQVADVDVDHPGLDGVFVTPDRVEDLLAAEHLAGVAGEEGQQVELGVRQLDLLPAAVDAALVDVDQQVA